MAQIGGFGPAAQARHRREPAVTLKWQEVTRKREAPRPPFNWTDLPAPGIPPLPAQ
jgi:hypothetical protein